MGKGFNSTEKRVAKEAMVELSQETSLDCGKKEDERRKKKRKLQHPEVENASRIRKVSQSPATKENREKKKKKKLNEEEAISNVAADSISSLELLKLIRNREAPNERKIQLAFIFVQTQQQLSPLSGKPATFFKMRLFPPTHFIAPLSEWVQMQISSGCKAQPLHPTIERRKKDAMAGLVGDSMLPAHLDERYWLVFRWCLLSGMQWKGGFISLSIMQALSRILDEASIVLSRDGLSTSSLEQTDVSYGTRSFTTAFFLVLLDVVKLLFCDYEGSFRPKLDSWVFSARSCLKLALMMCTCRSKFLMFGDGSSALFQLVVFMCRGFARFLKSSPNPRKVFVSVVEKLLECLLSLQASLGAFEIEGMEGLAAAELKGLTIAIQDILKYTLFHPVHLEGYLDVCKLSGGLCNEMEDKPNGRNTSSASASLLSYHKLLFEQLDHFVNEGKVSTMGSLAWVFRTYIKETNGQAISNSTNLVGFKGTLTSRSSGRKLIGRDNLSLGLGIDPSLDRSQEKKDPERGFFAVFVELLSPLVRNFEEIYPSFLSDKLKSLSTMNLVLTAVNSLLVVAKEEQVYVATEDTPTLTHLSYMRKVLNMFISFSNTLPELFNGALFATCHWNEEAFCLLMAVLKEVLLGIGHVLELEYRVVEDDLQSIWKTLLSASTLQFTVAKKRGKGLKVHHEVEVAVNLASRVMQIFGELRQVDRSIFNLCNFLRHLADSDQPPSLNKLQCKALTSIFLSSRFLTTIAALMKEVPEGQTSSFISSLKGDMEETLKCVQLRGVLGLNECHQMWVAAIKVLSEVSICLIENANVTASNSILVELSLKALVDGIVIESLGYLMDSALGGGNILANFVNFCAASLENTTPDTNGNSLANEAAQLCQAGANNSQRDCTLVLLIWELIIRLYISTKFLRRKCISLMPYKQARKACVASNDLTMSILMGEVSQAEEFLDGEGFFASVRKGAASLCNFLSNIDQWTLESGQKKVESLQYTLDCVAMLRLSDLKREIRKISYLLNRREPKTSENDEGEGGPKACQDDGLVGRDVLSKADRKNLRKHRKKLKLEASSLTSFMTKWVSSMEFESVRLDEIPRWNKVISSLDKRSLPVARWALLCQNIDTWSEFASEDERITFCHFMIGKTLLFDADKHKEESFCCNASSLTSSLLRDDSFYEQEPIREIFPQTLSQEVLETLSTFKVDMSIQSSLSYIESQVGSPLEAASTKWMRRARNQDVVRVKEDQNPSFQDVEIRKLTKCSFLLNLVSQAPKGYIKINSAASFISFISKLESSFLVWLLKTQCQRGLDTTESSSSMVSKRLLHGLDLLIACRRSSESLILHEASSNMALKGSCLAAVLLHDTSSMYWLLLSVRAIARCFNDSLNKNLDITVLDATKNKLLSYMKCTIGLFTFVSQNFCRDHLGPLLLRSEKEHIPSTKGVATPDSLLALVNTLASQMEKCSGLMKVQKAKVLDILSKQSVEDSCAKCPFDLLALLGAISTVVWSFTSTLEYLDEKCHLDKEGYTKWSGQLPEGVLTWVMMVDSFVTNSLNDLLLGDDNVSEKTARGETLKVERDFSLKADKAYTSEDEEDGLRYDTDANVNEDSDTGEVMDLEEDVLKIDKGTTSSLPNARDEQKLTSAEASGDFLEMQDLQVLMIREMLCGKMYTHAWMLGELFMAMAAIMKLKSLFHSPNVVDPVADVSNQQWTSAMQLHLGTASRILQEVVCMPQLEGSSCLILLPGVIKYLESIGSFLPYSRPTLSSAAFVDLVNTQLVLHGALLSRFQRLECLNSSDALKTSLLSCFRVFMKKPLGLHFHLTLQTVERSLLGLEGRRKENENDSETYVGGLQQDFIFLGGIECVLLLLDAVSGTKRLQILSRYTSRYLAAVFHLIAKSQLWCYKPSHPSHPKGALYPTLQDVACHSTINNNFSSNTLRLALSKCVEILTIFSSREVIFPMKANHLAQAMSCPADLFKHFYQSNLQKEKLMQSILKASDLPGSKDYEILIPDDRLVLEIYIACCKLLRNLLRHRTRESGHCVALLGESLRALLFFLEVMELSLERDQSFSELSKHSTLECASWLRRVYEEVAEHKNISGSYITHMLSDYICIISGYGMSIKGLSREVEATLRSGAFTLVDVCSTDDLQQLHAVLGEGPRRNSLTALRRDYEQHFKYTGKV